MLDAKRQIMKEVIEGHRGASSSIEGGGFLKNLRNRTTKRVRQQVKEMMP